MKSVSLAKALTFGALVCFTLPVACGDDDDTTPAASGGAGGEASGAGGDAGAGGATGALPDGLSDVSKTAMCGADSCQSAAVGPVFIDPCCADDACGLATGFLALVGAKFEAACQPKGQPGTVDEACPTSAASAVPFGGAMVPINGFVGCCRENGMCGVVVDDVTSPLGKLASLGLGCVDAAPFFPNETPGTCGTGGGGMGGAGGGGMGGAGGAGGMSGAGGGDAPGGTGGAGGNL